MGYVLIGLLFTGLLAGLLPFGCLGRTMQHHDWYSPLLMGAIALPLYIGPLQGMMRLGSIFEHGNSPGAAFVLFELGIGVNLGLIAWLMQLFGWRRVLAWLALIAAVTLGLAYAAERPLFFAHEVVDHTHAFDDWTSPLPWGTQASWQFVGDKLSQKTGTLEAVSLSGLAILLLLGFGIQRFDRHGAGSLANEGAASCRPAGAMELDRAGPGPGHDSPSWAGRFQRRGFVPLLPRSQGCV